MSYAAECLARGRSLFKDTLQGVRRHQETRWGVIFPLTLVGFVTFAMVGAGDTMVDAPWLDADGYDGGTAFFLALYSAVMLAAIAAPEYKGVVAGLIAIAGMVFCFPWSPRGTDFDAYWPNVTWGGSIVGGCLAFSLVMLKLRPRWLLLVPAYCGGFFVGGLSSWCLGPGFMTAFCASLGAIIFAVWMAPDHKKFVAMGAFLLTFSLSLYLSVTWGEIDVNMADQSFGGYFLGGAVALTLVLWRSPRLIESCRYN